MIVKTRLFIVFVVRVSLRPEVDLALCPDYLSKCSTPMCLSRVGKKLGVDNQDEREYLSHGELVSDLRLIYSNGMKYNDPAEVTVELDMVSEGTEVLMVAIKCSWCM